MNTNDVFNVSPSIINALLSDIPETKLKACVSEVSSSMADRSPTIDPARLFSFIADEEIVILVGSSFVFNSVIGIVFTKVLKLSLT